MYQARQWFIVNHCNSHRVDYIIRLLNNPYNYITTEQQFKKSNKKNE